MGHPTRMGIMGAILGGLQFALTENTQRRLEEVELAKQRRLEAIQLEREQRENVEWERRNAITQQDEQRRIELQHRLGVEEKQGEYDFREEQSERDREHDRIMSELNLRHDLTKEQKRHELSKRMAAYEEGLIRSRPPEMRGDRDPTADKGVLGSDGKTYKFGEALPPGVTAKGGYGISWAPSESKSSVPGSSRRVASRRPATNPSDGATPAPAAPPPGYVLVGYSAGKPVYRGPDGNTYIDE